MNYTSIEQSKKLLELGLSPESADNSWILSPLINQYIRTAARYDCDGDIPCWSVGALLEVMPKGIQAYDESGRCYKTYSLNFYQSYYCYSGYAFGPSLNQENHDMLCCFDGDTWIDAIYKQVVWLLENKYITNDDQSEKITNCCCN